jgi:uroporphyrinogen decarboxylase
VYPGANLIGATVRALVTDARVQCAASMALHERFNTPIVLSAMDLSAEAEAFGCEIQMGDNEVPTVTGRLVTSFESAQALPIPLPGTARTRVYLDTVRHLKQLSHHPLVLAGCIGPFSLAGRLGGVSEICELTLTQPELVHLLLEKCAAFLTAYVRAFKTEGADGIIMAEPAAGLLSPRSLAAFSSAYIRRIIEAIEDKDFGVVLHNCAARLAHLPAVLESGCDVLHFGAPMDIVSALDKVPKSVVLCGNLDPISRFVQASPAELARSTSALLKSAATHRNFIISSGCDVPHAAPLANLDAFFKTVQSEGGLC